MIETTHRGYRITYSENAEEWSCLELSYSHPKLETVRSRIDKLLLDERKKAGVSCYQIDHQGGRTAANVVEFIKTTKSKDYHGRETPATRHRVAIVAQRAGRERPARSEAELDNLMPDTPEANAAFERAAELQRIANEAAKAAREALKLVPRLTLDDVAELKRIKDTESEGA